MALTWKRRARRVKELKQEKLLAEQAKVIAKKEVAEVEVTKLTEKLREEQAAVSKAREQVVATQAPLAKAEAKGIAPFPKHVEAHEAAKQSVEAAAVRVNSVAKNLETVRATVPPVPVVPAVETFSLTRGEVLSIAFFVLLDVCKLNKWVALAIVGAGTAALYLAEKQGWTDFINF